MDFKYSVPWKVGDLVVTLAPSSGDAVQWGRGLLQAIELELPNFTAVATVTLTIQRGDDNFVVYSTAALAEAANYNLIVERYIRPTDKIVLTGNAPEETSDKVVYVRVLMR